MAQSSSAYAILYANSLLLTKLSMQQRAVVIEFDFANCQLVSKCSEKRITEYVPPSKKSALGSTTTSTTLADVEIAQPIVAPGANVNCYCFYVTDSIICRVYSIQMN